MGHQRRLLRIRSGVVLRATPVLDTYWRFAALRQQVFVRRLAGEEPPWTDDAVLQTHRFTNVYRASDRVSQYLIRNVIYSGDQSVEEVFFRVLLFKLFNRIETWECLTAATGRLPSYNEFSVERYAGILDAAVERNQRIYSAAYIMPSPPYGHKRKHRNHLDLLQHMMRDGAPGKVAGASSLCDVFEIMRGYPSLGDFLAYQFAIDLNYSEIVDHPEKEYVVAGPGARDGIRKCFEDTAGLTEREVICAMAALADEEFERLGLPFEKLGGLRPLQPIDCQNLFCEVDKYARVMHPEYTGASGRTRIKQRFRPMSTPLYQFYPPKWKVNDAFAGSPTVSPSGNSNPNLTLHSLLNQPSQTAFHFA